MSHEVSCHKFAGPYFPSPPSVSVSDSTTREASHKIELIIEI